MLESCFDSSWSFQSGKFQVFLLIGAALSRCVWYKSCHKVDSSYWKLHIPYQSLRMEVCDIRLTAVNRYIPQVLQKKLHILIAQPSCHWPVTGGHMHKCSAMACNSQGNNEDGSSFAVQTATPQWIIRGVCLLKISNFEIYMGADPSIRFAGVGPG